MAKVIFGNHSSVIVPQQDREYIRKFCERYTNHRLDASLASRHSGCLSYLPLIG
jgi:hypothetical protein